MQLATSRLATTDHHWPSIAIRRPTHFLMPPCRRHTGGPENHNTRISLILVLCGGGLLITGEYLTCRFALKSITAVAVAVPSCLPTVRILSYQYGEGR
jgi:hypothetical protein